MTTIKINLKEFPKLCEEFINQDYDNWIDFLHDQGYKFKWDHYTSNNKRKIIEMNEKYHTAFVLRWS